MFVSGHSDPLLWVNGFSVLLFAPPAPKVLAEINKKLGLSELRFA